MKDDGGSGDRSYAGRVLLGARLRALREGAGMTLAQASGAAGLSLSYLSDVERGRRLPSLEALDRLCAALGTLVVHALAGVFPFGSTVVPEDPGPPRDGRVRGPG